MKRLKAFLDEVRRAGPVGYVMDRLGLDRSKPIPTLWPALVAICFALCVGCSVLLGAHATPVGVPDNDVGITVLRMAIVALMLLFLVVAARFDAERRSNDVSRNTILTLREVQARQAAIFNSTADGIIILDSNGQIEAINPAAQRMLGVTQEESVGRHAFEFVPEALRGSEWPDMADIKSQIAERGIGAHFEVHLMRRDQSQFPATVAINMMQLAGRTSFVLIVSDITSRLSGEQHASNMANKDFLTGLPNRMVLHDRLQVVMARAKTSGRFAAVLMVDLDHFKRVNDSLGHDVGDQLLIAVANRIRESVRSTDVVVRMGGDEFVVILGELPATRVAAEIGTKILHRVSAGVHIAGRDLQVSASVGACVYPSDGQDVHTLLKNADTAMYRAKAGGRARFASFTGDMAKDASMKLELENALRRAVEREEFRIHYQPQVCLVTGRVVGVEALLRWNGPDGVPVPPSVFIPIAEESRLIEQIGAWVLRTACTEIRRYQDRTGILLQVAVNLSPRQFIQDDLPVLIEDALANSGLASKHLELEITEGTLMAETEETHQRLRAVRDLGVSIAVDDFGVGYSSLAYVTRLPIDSLKIDRAFIANLSTRPSDAAVAQVIITLGESLNLNLVAEGIETPEQLQFVRTRHCGRAQGYLLAVPAPLDQLRISEIEQRYAAIIGLPAVGEQTRPMRLVRGTGTA